MDDVTINKVATIERCLKRIKEEYLGYEDVFKNNFTKQDSVVLNINRAIQAAIDLAMHFVRINKLGIPQNSRDVFVMLADAKFIKKSTSDLMQKMVGFRNIAIDDYQSLNIEIVITVINDHLNDFKEYISEILSYKK